jgi:arylsulfatase A-like enzyme
MRNHFPKESVPVPLARIISNLQAFFRPRLRFLALAPAVTLLLFLAFRTMLYAVYTSIYPGTIDDSPVSFLLAALASDLPVLLHLCLAYLVISLLPWRLARYLAFAFLGIVLVLILFVALGHLEVLEAPLTLKSLGTGLDTFWQEIVNSAQYEISDRLLANTAQMLLILVSAVTLGALADRRRHRGLHLASWLAPLLLFAWTVRPVFAGGSAGETAPLAVQANIPSRERLLENPLAVLWRGPQANTEEETVRTAPTGEFRFRLDTTALYDNRVHPRLDLPRGKKYHIILYFFESTKASYLDLEVNGQPVTPHWRRLQQHAFVARNHYANFPLSANALFSVLGSAYDLAQQKCIPLHYPGTKVRTIPEILGPAGYRTAVLHSGTLEVYGHRNFLQGRGLDAMIELRDFLKAGWRPVTAMSVDDRAMIEPGVAFARADRTKPFFMAFFPFMPHHPYLNPEPSLALYSDETIRAERDPKKQGWLRYVNSLRFADERLGELVDTLDKEDLLEDTLLFVFADHGQAFYQHKQNYLHSFFIYEENVHVPFLVYNKKLFPKPVEYTGVSRHIDVLPSIFDLLRIPCDPEHEGISLFSRHESQHAVLHTDWGVNLIGIRDGKYKYIRKVYYDKTEELYDLETDPGETHNLAKELPEVTAKLREAALASRDYKLSYYERIFARGWLPGSPPRTNVKPPEGHEGHGDETARITE